MLAYSGRIVREVGASVLTIASGGSINLPTGGVIQASGNQVFSGGITLGQASTIGLAGGLTSWQTGACVTINVTTADQGTWALNDGTRRVTFGTGRNAPTHSASGGSLYLRSDGSMSNVYYNIADGAAGSVWRTTASG